jgi:hypothetical protein
MDSSSGSTLAKAACCGRDFRLADLGVGVGLLERSAD